METITGDSEYPTVVEASHSGARKKKSNCPAGCWHASAMGLVEIEDTKG